MYYSSTRPDATHGAVGTLRLVYVDMHDDGEEINWVIIIIEGVGQKKY